MIWQVTTCCAEETQALGRLMGSLVTRSATIFLCGDLGTGKTCLTRGIGESLAEDGDLQVSSPSYTLMNLYSGRLNLYHFDLYRLSDMDEVLDIGFEDYLRQDGIIVVEWAERVAEMEEDGLYIHLCHVNDIRRELVFEARGETHMTLLQQLADLWPEKRDSFHGGV